MIESRVNCYYVRKVIGLGATLLLCGFVLAGVPARVFDMIAHAQNQSGKVPGGIQPAATPTPTPGSRYRQTNLVSDIPGYALIQDPLIVNPWGISMTATSPFWLANNGTSTSSLYRGDVGSTVFFKQPGMPSITIPGGLPTGTVANGTTDFVVTSGAASGPARFIFASITGNISGWNPNVPAAGSTVATIAASHPGHVYTGLTLGNNGANLLYAADFANNKIDVFNDTFALTTVPGGFVDPTIPAGFAPFNIQNIGGSLYVAYAKVGPDGRDEDGVGNGFVRRFNANGVRDLTFGINNGPLNSPWGLVIAPASFGLFGSALLVGNFGEGNPSIHAFNPTTGAFLGILQDESGTDIVIDELWAMVFGNGGNGGDPNTLYFASGPAEEEHGLFGSLKPITTFAPALVQFSASAYDINEGDGSIQITVTRTGSASGTATVNFATFDESQTGHASQRSDYEIAVGTLRFDPGETSKTFRLLLVDDAFPEGDEVVDLAIVNPTGAGLGSPSVAELTIQDNEPAPIATTRSGTGANAAAIQATVDAFRADLGALNANVAGSLGSGRREINWDGVPDAFSAPTDLPGDFFNVNSPRGVVLSTPGPGLRVSMDDDTGADADPDQVRFSDVNATYATAFQTFSPQRLFAARGSNVVNINFFVAGSTTPATVSGFGAVFTDVDVAGSTVVQFFDQDGFLISEQSPAASAGSGNLSFLGVSFTNRRIRSVRIVSGNTALGPTDNSPGIDVVAMDDFIYGEPIPIPPGFNNPIDTTSFFVRQQYLDFLGREPDSVGFTAWVNLLNGCAAGNTACDRVIVSQSFFQSPESLSRGYFAFRFYRAAFGRDPFFGEYMGDLSRLGGTTAAETTAAKANFPTAFTQRNEFQATLDALTNAQYVDRLIANTGLAFPNRDQLVADLNAATKTRAQVLNEIVEAAQFVQDLPTLNRAFVLAEYFGYLRRDPDTAGFNMWIDYLSTHPGDFRTMVNGFVNSIEYRSRFGTP